MRTMNLGRKPKKKHMGSVTRQGFHKDMAVYILSAYTPRKALMQNYDRFRIWSMEMLNGMKSSALVIIGCIFLGSYAQATSFNCGNATTNVEKLICADAELSKLDDELAAAYKTALQDEDLAESNRQAQKQWLKERNGCADSLCVKSAYETRLLGLSPLTDAHALLLAKELSESSPSLPAPDKPGLFKLDQSTNDKVCIPLGQIINADITKYGKTRFGQHSEFVKWRKVEEERIDRGEPRSYSESVEQADVDINNDDVVDQVIRTRWSMSGVLNDRFNIFPERTLTKDKIGVFDLLNSDKKSIMFNSGNFWLERHIKKHGDSNEDWYFGGIASIDLMRKNNETYLVAENYAAPRDISAKIYVFQLDKDYQPNDVCMFVKICPCSGCKNLRGNQPIKTLPAKKWCGK